MHPPIESEYIMADFLISTTRYEEESVRFKCAERMMAEAKRLNYPVVVVDGSSVEMTASLAWHDPHLYQEVTKGMGATRRYAFFMAQELSFQRFQEQNYFLWLEPEKYDLLRFVTEILEPIKRGEADIVIPRRSEMSWATYPEFQFDTESQLNTAYQEATGLLGFDGAFGPVAFNMQAAKYFVSMNPQEYDTRLDDGYINLMAPIVAKHHGCTLASVIVDFKYPPEQKAEEEAADNDTMRDKRRAQLEMNGRSFLRIAEVLRNIS